MDVIARLRLGPGLLALKDDLPFAGGFLAALDHLCFLLDASDYDVNEGGGKSKTHTLDISQNTLGSFAPAQADDFWPPPPPLWPSSNSELALTNL